MSFNLLYSNKIIFFNFSKMHAFKHFLPFFFFLRGEFIVCKLIWVNVLFMVTLTEMRCKILYGVREGHVLSLYNPL